MDTRLLHPENAEFQMILTLWGMAMEARFLHPSNKLSFIDTKLFGKETDCRFVHPQKTPCPKTVPLLGISIVVKLLQPQYVLRTDNQLLTC